MSPRSSDAPAVPDLELVDLVKRFKGASRIDEVVALDGLTLSVEPGTVLAIVGSNGAGKSTLLSAIAGSALVDEGRILVKGRDVTTEPSWRRSRYVARVRQNPEHNVFGTMTIEENFALRWAGDQGSFSLRRAGGRRIRDAAREALAPFGMGLENRLSTLASTLSGGQRQAVAVAMATLGRSSVLLLDEHVAALDPKSARLVSERTEEIVRDGGITTLVVTHDMGRALERSDRLLMLHRGAIVMDLDRMEKSRLDVPALVERFEALAGEAVADRALLT